MSALNFFNIIHGVAEEAGIILPTFALSAAALSARISSTQCREYYMTLRRISQTLLARIHSQQHLMWLTALSKCLAYGSNGHMIYEINLAE